MDLSGKVALICEGDKPVRGLVAMSLQEMGMQTIEVDDPGQVVESISRKCVDLVITADFAGAVYRPGQHWRTVDLVRTASCDAPIIGLTGWTDAVKEGPERIGLNDLIAKPFDLGEFQRRVWAVMAGRGGDESRSAPCSPDAHDR